VLHVGVTAQETASGGDDSPRVFSISASDPLTLAAVASTLAVVARMASLVPAYRASRLDPVEVLRAD
jgi:ABC-type antimicrobial peptide transport system permease subunit